MKYVIANWKAQKNYHEAQKWIETFMTFPSLPEVEIIIAPSYPYLPFIYEKIQGSSVKLASQDISPFENGKHTGEVTAEMISDLVSYAIIGHSERRKEFHETTELLETKTHLLRAAHIEPIYCIRGIQDIIPEEVTLVSYEPEGSIGNGNNIDIEQVLHVKKSLSVQGKKFIYGGSVDVENASMYLNHPEIDGVLVGTDCADPQRFYEIAKQAV